MSILGVERAKTFLFQAENDSKIIFKKALSFKEIIVLDLIILYVIFYLHTKATGSGTLSKSVAAI